MPAPAANPFDQFDEAPAEQAPAAAAPADANPFDQFDEAPSAPAQAAPAQPSAFDRFLGSKWSYATPAGPTEAAAHFGTAAIAAPIAGLAGLGTAATNAVGLTNTPAADVVEKVSSAMTYQPKSVAGQGYTKVIGYPFEKMAALGDRAGDVINNAPRGQSASSVARFGYLPEPTLEGRAAVAAGVNAATQAVPALLAKGRAPEAAAKPAAVAMEVTPRQALAQELVAKKIKLTPTQVGNKVAGVAEGLTGHAKLERSLSLKNAPQVNKLVGEDVGLKDAKTITEGDITRLKVEANKPYREISRTGVRRTSDDYRNEIQNIGDRTGGESFAGDVPPDIVKLKDYYAGIKQFNANDAVNKIRQLRAEASKNIKAVNAPEQNAKGHVQRAIADALDNELTRHVESLGKPELAAKYKAARVQLAKVYTLEDALEGSNVSARSLAQALDRGVPLSANMELIARAYKEFDHSFQDVGKIRDGSPFGVLDLGAGVVGAASSLPLAAAVLARPTTRAVLASDAYQRRFIGGGSPSAKNLPLTPAEQNALATGVSISAPNALSQRARR